MKFTDNIFSPQPSFSQALLWSSFIFSALFLTACDNTTAEQNVNLVTIKDVTIIDASNGQRDHMSVTLSGNTITKVSAAQSAAPTTGTIIDGKGKYLIPGLWDAHVHLSYTPELENVFMPLLIHNGITSVRDTGGLIEKVLPHREHSRNNPRTTPRVFIAGPLLDGFPTVYDGTGGRSKLAITLKTPTDAIKAVDTLHEQGVDFVKAYEMLTPETFTALVKRAKLHGLKIAGHIPLSMTAKQVSDAGIDSMEHFRNLHFACSTDADALYKKRKDILANSKIKSGGDLRSKIHKAQHTHGISTYDEAACIKIAQTLAKNETWQLPTLGLYVFTHPRQYNGQEWEKTFTFLPENLKSVWQQRFGSLAASKYVVPQTSIDREEWFFKVVRVMNEQNVGFLAGTDTPLFGLTPGYSLHLELALLVKAGLTPIQALESATISPASYFGLEDKLGKIESGMIADLILLNANPLDDIRNTQKIDLVIKDGHVMDKDARINLISAARDVNY